MKLKFIFAALLVAVLLPELFSGCSVSRKAQAASILQKCSLEVSGGSFDSAAIDKKKILDMASSAALSGGLLPIPKAALLVQNIAKGNFPDSLGTLYFAIALKVKNASEDTLWLRSAKGSVRFDSLAELPIEFKDSAIALVPGKTPVTLHSRLPIGPSVLKILSADTLRVVGDLDVSLAPDGELIPFQANQSKKILPEERAAFIDKAKQSIQSTIIDAWTATLH